MTAPRALVLSGFFLACVSAGSSGFGESPAESIPPAEQAEAERRVDAEPSPLPFTAAGFVELASRELERGRTARAAELVHLAARLPIDDRALLRTFADIALRSGAIDEGQRAARRLLREKPTDVRHHALMADAYRARGNLKESLSAADRALEANDRSQEAHASKGTTLLAAGNHEHAAESFRRALALDPTHAPALRGWAELLLARPLPPAVADLSLLDAASERIARDHPLAESYAQLLIAADRGDEAERKLKALLRSHPARIEARLLLARASANPLDALAQLDTLQQQAGPAARAIAALARSSADPAPELLRAHGLAPDDRAIMRELVQAQLRAGDLAAARKTLAGADTVSVEHTELLLAAGASEAATRSLRSLAPTLNESGRERIARAFGEAGPMGSRILDSLVVAWPESSAPLAARASIAHHEGRYGAATDDLRIALRRSRRDCTLTARLMSALRHDGDPHAAWRVARGAIPLACEEAALSHQSAQTALAVGDSATADSMWWALGAGGNFTPRVRSSALLDLSQLRRSRGRPEDALVAMRRAFALTPKDARIAIEEARSHLALGSPARARERVAPWAADPVHGAAVSTLLETAKRAAANHRAEEARLRQAFEAGDRSPRVRSELADLILRSGNAGEALAILGEVDLHSGEPTRLLRSLAYARDAAFSASQGAHPPRPEVTSAWNAYLAEPRPSDHRAYRRLAHHLAAAGDPQRAAGVVENAPGPVEAPDFVAIASHVLAAAQPERANALLNDAAIDFPRSTEIALARARIRADSGKWAGAAALFGRALSLAPSDTRLALDCAEGLIGIDERDEAARILVPLLATTSDLRARLLLARASKDPTSAQRILREASAAARPEELRRIAATALATDSPSTAVEIYARALAADPADPISRVGEAIALSRAGDPAAKKIMEGASEDTELSPTLQLRLASEWLRRGDPASCLPLTMRATEKMPSATAHREAGRALLALGRTSESIAQLREAIGFDAGDALTHLTLAEALIHMGDTGAARPHLVRATLLDPRVITRSRAIELAGNLDP